jgi:hypothetical protein
MIAMVLLRRGWEHLLVYRLLDATVSRWTAGSHGACASRTGGGLNFLD